MATRHQSKPALERVKLHIPYPMTMNEFVSNGCRFIALHEANGDSNVAHIFVHRVGPESVTIFLVDIQGFLRVLQDSGSELMRLLVVAIIYRANDHFSFLQSDIGSPFECRLIIYLLCLGIFCDLNWIGFL